MRPLRKLLRHNEARADGTWLSFRETYKVAGVPPVAVRLIAARLRFFARLELHASPMLRALMAGPAGAQWREAWLEDARFMKRVLDSKLGDMPDPADTAPWSNIVKEFPGQWKSLVAAFVDEVSGSPHLIDVAEKIVVSRQPPEQVVAVRERPTCYDCGRCFETLAGLKMHQRVVHGMRRPGHRFVLDGRCPACGGDYHTPLRALEHLERGSARCRAVLDAGGLVALDDETLAAADSLDRWERRGARAVGRHERGGLPARPARLAA